MFNAPFSVLKTTTDKLEKTLNDISCDGGTVHTLQWVGGRDWVIAVLNGFERDEYSAPEG